MALTCSLISTKQFKRQLQQYFQAGSMAWTSLVGGGEEEDKGRWGGGEEEKEEEEEEIIFR